MTSSEPVTSNPLASTGTSASALAPQLDAMSVSTADQPAKMTDEAMPSASGSRNRMSYDGPIRDTDAKTQPQRISHDSLSAQRQPSGLASSRPQDANKTPEALELLENEQGETEPGYPSPSGAFVPPGSDEDWKPKEGAAILVRNGQGVVDQRRQSRNSLGKEELPPSRPTSIPKSQATTDRIRRASSRATSRRGSTANTDRANVDGGSTSGSVFPPQKVGSRRPSKVAAVAESPEQMQAHERSQPEPIPTGKRAESNATEEATTTSSSSSSFLAGSAQSQAISARSSPSTVAPLRRPSSGLGGIAGSGRDSEQQSRTSGAVTGDHEDASQDNDLLPPLKIRDFGFPDKDPRHGGAREAGVGSPLQPGLSPSSKAGFGGFGGGTLGGPAHEWSIGGIDHDADDEDDIVDEPDVYDQDGGGSDDSFAEGLPLGLYHAAYDFSAESEHELDVKVGQRVRLVGHVDGGWAIVMRVPDGVADVGPDDEGVDKGLVPEAYLQWLGA